MRTIPILAAGFLAAGIAALPAVAQDPDIQIRRSYYDVAGTVAAQLRENMRRDGPQGSWAYTHWTVRWDSTCRVELEIDYEFPRLQDRNKVPLPLRRRWDRMMDNLHFHEEGHAQNGLGAAREVLAANCNDARAITKKWAARDRAYDRATNHGKTQGVRLSD